MPASTMVGTVRRRIGSAPWSPVGRVTLAGSADVMSGSAPSTGEGSSRTTVALHNGFLSLARDGPKSLREITVCCQST